MDNANPYAAPTVDAARDIPEGMTPEQIRAIGAAYRMMTLLLLMTFLGMAAFGASAVLLKDVGSLATVVAGVVVVMSLVLRLGFAVLCFRLARALGSSLPSQIIWALAGLVFALLAGLILRIRAAGRLREAGIRVGFLGPSAESLTQLELP